MLQSGRTVPRPRRSAPCRCSVRIVNSAITRGVGSERPGFVWSFHRFWHGRAPGATESLSSSGWVSDCSRWSCGTVFPWQCDALAAHVERLQPKKGAMLIERGIDDGFTYFLTAGRVALGCAGKASAVVGAARDAECRMRKHEKSPDVTDLLINARTHECMRPKDTAGLLTSRRFLHSQWCWENGIRRKKAWRSRTWP